MPGKVTLSQLQKVARGPKRLRRKRAACGPELNSVLACLKSTNFDAASCRKESRLLTECMAAAKGAKKAHKPTVNYHMQRIYRD